MATLAQVIAGKPAIKVLKQDYPAIASALNAPTTVANPDAGKKTNVPVSVTRESVMAQVPDAEAWAIYTSGPELVNDMFAAIDTQNSVWLAKLLGIASQSGKLSAGTLTKLQTLLTTTTEVTAPATIPGPSIAAAAGLGIVTESQIQQADIDGKFGGKW